MKILLFGGSGQLGYDLIKRADALNFQIVSPVVSEVDISNSDQVKFLVEKVAPDLIVNSAAYTNVDGAEVNKEEAFAINRDGARFIAEAAKQHDLRMIHISTDYVYDGKGSQPIREDHPTGPLNVYGQSKLEGDQAVLSILGDRGVVVRTSWLHGSRGANFVKTMINLFKEKEELSIVDDQIGSPTWTGWLAEAILDLGRIECNGVIHATCAGEASWLGFAQEILEMVRGEIETSVVLKPQSTDQAARPADRPHYSTLDCSKLSQLLGREPILWQDGLRYHLIELGFMESA